MSSQIEFEINPNMTVSQMQVGVEQEKVLILDDVLLNPEAMVDFAVQNGTFDLYKKAGNFYPGVRFPPPRAYYLSLMSVVKELIINEYALPKGAQTKAESSLSLMTLPPEELSVVQSLPHFDSANPKQFALLHYLCDEQHGGTAFYRHKQTGFETINRERFAEYTSKFMKDIETNGPPLKEYIVDTNERFQKIDELKVKYNRLVIYRSFLLHSACINPEVSLDTNPRTGRLTANTFLIFD